MTRGAGSPEGHRSGSQFGHDFERFCDLLSKKNQKNQKNPKKKPITPKKKKKKKRKKNMDDEEKIDDNSISIYNFENILTIE